MKGDCAFCGAVMDMIDKNHYNCSTCGFGWNGELKNLPNMEDHLKKIINLTKYLITQYPNKTQQEYVNLVMEKLHSIEKHPVNRHGYCEYCSIKYTLTDEQKALNKLRDVLK